MTRDHSLTPSPAHPLSLRPAVFLDRDGVINRDSEDFIKSADELDLLPGAAEAVARLNAAGLLCVVITNQSGIGRGLFDEAALDGLHAALRAELAKAGARLDGIYHCPHLPDAGCECRKPAPGLPNRAATELGIDLRASWFVGDRTGDIGCGAAAGVRTILVLTGQTARYDPALFSPPPDHVCPDLAAAVEVILAG